MRCQTCGEELREGARFCPTCGTPTSDAGSNSLTPPTVQIRRPLINTAADDPAGEPQLGVAAADEIPPAASPTGRTGRDPGAGYDPTGPSRPAGQAAGQPVRATTIAPARSRGEAPPGGDAPRVAAPVATPSSADFNSLIERAQRLLRFDTGVFGDLYQDTRAMVPAAIFAAIVFLIAGFGGYLYIESLFDFDRYELIAHGAGEFFLRSVILGTLFGLLAWAAWAAVTGFLLRQFTGAEIDLMGIARVLAFALAPLVLALLLFWTDVASALSWIALGGVASLAVIGVLESVDVRPGHAWLATLAGFAVFVIVLAFLGHATRDLAPGFFVLG